MKLTVKILKNEYWWGGDIPNASKAPFDSNTELQFTTAEYGRTGCQCAPFFLSSKGRYIWSDKGFEINFNKGVIECEGKSEIILNESGNTLREAFLNAKKERFPYNGEVHTERLFYEVPQFNTWVELIKDQTEEGILRYAEGLVANGYKQGILMIDDGWQKEHGTWQFDKDKFTDPKGMIEKLHKMGFKVMLWISPYISLSSDRFLDLAREYGIECDNGHLLRLADGRVAIHKWWNGYCAMFDFTKEKDWAYAKEQLDILVNEYGVDGFKFDGGDYTWEPVNKIDTFSSKGSLGGFSAEGRAAKDDPINYGWRLSETKVPTADELNAAWTEFALQYPLHEMKNHYKSGHLPVITRLHDKAHVWGANGLGDLIPHGMFVGLIGNPFVCPDMVGGGSWTDFAYGKIDQELFVRSAECSALFPMMQFSGAPWRLLSKENAKICYDMAQLHISMHDEIVRLVEHSEKTGEPILRNMEYQFPGEGLEKVTDQFMLGDNYLVAPVITKGAVTRTVKLPSGKWQSATDGKIYQGGETIEVSAPLNVLPYFKRV